MVTRLSFPIGIRVGLSLAALLTSCMPQVSIEGAGGDGGATLSASSAAASVAASAASVSASTTASSTHSTGAITIAPGCKVDADCPIQTGCELWPTLPPKPGKCVGVPDPWIDCDANDECPTVPGDVCGTYNGKKVCVMP